MSAAKPDTVPPVDVPSTTIVFLDTPIKRGDQVINQVILRKPDAPEMRGLSMLSLIQMETNAVEKLLPRISTPALLPGDVKDGADLFAMATEVANFLLNRNQRADSPPA